MVDDHTRLNIHVCRLTHKITRTHVRRSTFQLWFNGSLAAARLWRLSCGRQWCSAALAAATANSSLHCTETAATAATAATQRRRSDDGDQREDAPERAALHLPPRDPPARKLSPCWLPRERSQPSTMQQQLWRPPVSNVGQIPQSALQKHAPEQTNRTRIGP